MDAYLGWYRIGDSKDEVWIEDKKDNEKEDYEQENPDEIENLEEEIEYDIENSNES